MKPLTRDAFLSRNKRPGSGCTLKPFMERMTPADARELREAIADTSVQVSAIQTVMRERGWKYSRYVFERHRNDGCTWCGMKASAPRR